jgi:hypothetical protein
VTSNSSTARISVSSAALVSVLGLLRHFTVSPAVP